MIHYKHPASVPLLRGGAAACGIAGVCHSHYIDKGHTPAPLKRGILRAVHYNNLHHA